jgi:hypothetical protein
MQRCEWGFAFKTPHCDKLNQFKKGLVTWEFIWLGLF